VAKAFGRVVRKEREGQGIAQDAFALLANVDRSYYGKLERGERQLSLGLLLRISSGGRATRAEIVQSGERAQRK
jgi:transcriptional regulator with XRE-family HTH domain